MTRFNNYLFLFLTSCILACSPGSGKKDIIAPEKMKSLLKDMVVAEEYANSKVQKDSTLSVKDETIKLYTQVLELHQATRQKFLKSFDYYLSKPEIARAMFDSLSINIRKEYMQVSSKPQ
jgi:uncharacterized membrane-anchored protein YjiN (DUF445 family)